MDAILENDYDSTTDHLSRFVRNFVYEYAKSDHNDSWLSMNASSNSYYK